MSGGAGSAGPGPGASRPAIPRSKGSGPHPLSFGQQRLWLVDRLEPGIPLYNEGRAIRIRGPLDAAILEQAVDAVVARHETLRTTITLQGDAPFQTIGPVRPVGMRLVDLRGRLPAGGTPAGGSPAADAGRALGQLLRDETRRPFDLAADLLLRATLVRLAADDHVLLLVMHHIASDGWSYGILFREIGLVYGALKAGRPSPLPELPLRYADYAWWQRERLEGGALAEQLEFWKKRLSGMGEALELPADHPRPAAATYRGGREEAVLPATLVTSLKALGRRERATTYMVLLAGFVAVLHRYTGRDDIVVGTPAAGRPRPELEGLVGFFVNTLVMRFDLSGDPSFRELVARARETALGAFGHQDVPFDRLVQELRPDRVAGRTPLAGIMLNFVNIPRPAYDMGELQATDCPVDDGLAKFDLDLRVSEEDGAFNCRATYATDLFEPATMARFLGHLGVLLEGATAHPDRRLSELPLLTEAERHQILVDWNDTSADFPRDALVHELFEAQAAQRPQAAAAVSGEDRLSYAELDRRADLLAGHLGSLGVGPDVIVGLCVERSLDMVIGMLGILKAGGAYLPLDPSYPSERLAFMIEDSGAPVVLTQRALLERLPAGRAATFCLDADWGEIGGADATVGEATVGGAADTAAAAAVATSPRAPAAMSPRAPAATSPRARPTADNLAYVMYTSGSTGAPKGVAVSHRAVVSLVADNGFFTFEPGDSVGQVVNPCFDLATLEVWGALTSGAKLVIIPQDTLLSPRDFAAFIEQRGIGVLNPPTALFNATVAEAPAAFRKVRVLMFGGETADRRHVESVLQHGRPGQLLNAYGPTEATTWATLYEVPGQLDPERPVSIGRPMANVSVYVLDRYGNPVPVGVPGELHIGGPHVARGYLGRQDLTAERFIPDPFAAGSAARLYRTGDLARWLPDGNLEFIGRMDGQVKIRGSRVELGEVEAVLTAHPGVREAAVTARSDLPQSRGERCLVAYVTGRAGAAPEAGELRAYLRGRLPGYMVPDAFVALDAMPLTPNGKVDRRALPAPQAAGVAAGQGSAGPGQGSSGPRDAVEAKLVGMWETILGVSPVGVEDDFFEIGGHSLLAARLFREIELEFGRRLPLSTLMHNRTVEGLARVLREEEAAPGWDALVRLQAGRPGVKPFFWVHAVGGNILTYWNLARFLGPERPVYGLQARGLDGWTAPFASIEEMAAHYVARVREAHPDGPYNLGGYCFGGVVAFEMARQLAAQGQRVGLVALLDASAPDGTWQGERPLRTMLPELVAFHLGNLWSLPLKQKLAYLAERTGRFVRKTGRRSAEALSGPPGAAQRPDPLQALELANHNALKAYVPQPYPGRLTLFRSAHGHRRTAADPLLRWGNLAGEGVEVIQVPGRDSSMLTGPNAKALAEKIRACLDRT